MRYLRHVRLLCVTMSLASIILEIPVLSSSTIQGESQQRTTRDQNYAAAMSGLLASHREMLNNLQEYLNTARTSTAETTKRSVPPHADRQTYSGLRVSDKPMRIRVRIDLVLIGFQGGGGHPIDVPRGTLELWLKHLNETLPHVATEDRTPQSNSERSGGSPSNSAGGEVEYAYQFQVIDVSKKVLHAVEAHMRAYLRDEATTTETPMRRMYMPSWHMENLLGSLLSELRETKDGLEKRSGPAFTLFVLNPRRLWIFPGLNPRTSSQQKNIKYGYRCGLSETMMSALATDPEVIQRAEYMERAEKPGWRVVEDGSHDGVQGRRWPYAGDSGLSADEEPRPNSGVKWVDCEQSSYQWAMGTLEALPRRPEKADSSVLNQPTAAQQGKDADDVHQETSWTISHEKAFLLQGGPDTPPRGRARLLLRDILQEARHEIGRDHAKDGNGVSGRACLTDAWVSGHRFAWIDLQAGPFEWGPAAGGKGIKTATTFDGLVRPPHRIRHPFASAASGGAAQDHKLESDAIHHEEIQDHVLSLLRIRKKLSSRVRRLAGLEERVECGGNGGEMETKTSVDYDQGRGMLIAACGEISAQLAFLRQFESRERDALSLAEESAAKETGGADHLGQKEELQKAHFSLLQEVLHELAPLTESDYLGSAVRETIDEHQLLDVETRAVLARLAAAVATLSRSIVLPASMLPLSVPCPNAGSPRERNASREITRSSARDRRDFASERLSPPVSLAPPDISRVRGTGNVHVIGSTATGGGGMGTEHNIVGNDRIGANDGRHLAPLRLPSGPDLERPHGFTELTGRGGATAGHPLPPVPRPSAHETYFPESLSFTLHVVQAQDVYPPLGGRSSFGTAADISSLSSRRVSDSDTRHGERENGVTHPEEAMGSQRGSAVVEEEAGPQNERQQSKKFAGTDGSQEGSSGFDLVAFQEGLMSMRLPNQRVSITVQQVAASRHAVLATALAGAMEESLVNVITADGAPLVEKRLSISSAKIHHQLKGRLDGDRRQEDTDEDAHLYARNIAIFLFSLAGPESVYVDEMWHARAAGGDTVIVAQSEARRDATVPLVCDGRAIGDDPRNPVRQALAAVGSVVGGLGPSQDTWDERTGGVTHDWRWSMSESPMSPIVPHALFSKVDKDVICRAHVARALTASLQLSRAATEPLLNALSQEHYRIILEGPLAEQLENVTDALEHAGNLRVILADRAGVTCTHVTETINPLLDRSRRAYSLTSQLLSEVDSALRAQGGGISGSSSDSRRGDSEESSPRTEVRGLARMLLALTIAVSAVWSLVRSMLSASSAGRRRKVIKVN